MRAFQAHAKQVEDLRNQARGEQERGSPVENEGNPAPFARTPESDDSRHEQYDVTDQEEQKCESAGHGHHLHTDPSSADSGAVAIPLLA